MKDDIFTIEHKGQTDEEKEKARIAKEEADKQRRINFGITFSTREGFDTLMEIMKFCHFSQISYVRGDQAETAFREGERNIALYILSQLSDEMKQKIIIGG